jgi:hypothetical protein
MYFAFSRFVIAAGVSCGLLAAAPYRAAYYNSSWNAPPIQSINWPAWTMIFHFNAYPRLVNGTVTLDTHELVNTDLLVSTAHQHQVKVLLTVLGSWDFVDTTDTPDHVNALVSLIGNYAQSHGYDGVDIDWETVVPQAAYTNFMTALRARLNAYTPAFGRPSDGKPMISGFMGPIVQAAANLASMDLLNLSCSDDHSWDSSRWIIWHDASLRDPGDNGVGGGGYSCAKLVAATVALGVPVSKIGATFPFFVRDWIGGQDASGNGALRPGQLMSVPPVMGGMQSLNQLFNTPSLWQQQYMHRDGAAGNSAYLSVDNAGSGNDHFISYPDASSITAAWNFVTAGYGGVPLAGFTGFNMMHEWIAGGSTTAQRFPLSEALRIAAGQ